MTPPPSNSSFRLQQIAAARSGDKGNHVTLGVIAHRRAGYDYLIEHLTETRVAEFFEGLGATRVERFALPKLWSVMFLLHNGLGGGASQSLRIDTQGKLLGTAILEMELPAPDNLDAMLALEA